MPGFWQEWLEYDALTDQVARGEPEADWVAVGRCSFLLSKYIWDIQLEPSKRLLNIWV